MNGDPGRTDAGAHGADAPIAVVGIACRFPGARTLDAFWDQLAGEVCAVTEGEPGSGKGRVGDLFRDPGVRNPACRFGAYIDGVDLFDAAFFRISPVEAQFLDPQQRLMLETSWQALEDAGIDPDSLRGSRTGVFAGISNNEYRALVMASEQSNEPAASLYSVSGTSFNTAIGRVAFALGLQGPAIALDTACSSSLVAVHQAVVALQRGEADMALAGGVHTILSGHLLEMRANAGMLAPDGRCKTFDAAANGYVRGEGCGILVLKHLAKAQADGDRIWGVIRGSAINQDGASPGLTVPNGSAQELVIEAALASAGLDPALVDYVEAHGTGTTVGDPIEAQATGTAYGRARAPDRPLLIGSVKTNIGHLEAAAGVAALVKVLLAMRHRVIPRHLHFADPSPAIDWDNLPLKVVTEATPWPGNGAQPPRAGISGFGWSGTNAHLIVEGYPAADNGQPEPGWPVGAPREIPAEPATAQSPLPRPARFLSLSGKTPKALSDLARRYLHFLDRNRHLLTDQSLASDRFFSDMAYTAGIGRSHFDYRAGLVFADLPSLQDQLTALAENEPADQSRPPGKLAFAYTGQASQWPGMGRTLYETEPAFRAVLERCDAALARDQSLLDVILGNAGDLDDPAWTQPAIYALECALTALWESIGLRPDIVVGHSLGEIAAAQAAGVFSLEDGLAFAAARGELMGSLPGNGAMAAVFAPARQVAEIVADVNSGHPDPAPGISVAADNGDQQVVSGPASLIEAIVARFESANLWVARLKPSPAYHSAMVEPALPALRESLTTTTINPPRATFLSGLTGKPLPPDTLLDAGYWADQARNPVAFRACISALAELETGTVIEIGPQPVLGPMISLGWPNPQKSPINIASLRGPARNDAPAPPDQGFARPAARAYEAGLALQPAGLYAGERRHRIALPTYPFQRRRHWVKTGRRRQAGEHPLLGRRHDSPRGPVQFESEISGQEPAWLSDHQVFGRVVAPGALYAALAGAALRPGGSGPVLIEDLQLHTALVLPEDQGDDESGPVARRLQVLLDPGESGSGRLVEIYSQGEGEEAWTQHAAARVSDPGPRGGVGQIQIDDLTAGFEARDVAGFYRDRAAGSIELGPQFRTLRRLWAGAGEAVGEVGLAGTAPDAGTPLHPVLLDGCFQVIAAARAEIAAAESLTYLPFAIERLWLDDCLPPEVLCHARMRAVESDAETPEVLTADLRIYDLQGSEVGSIEGYTVKRATRAALLSATVDVSDLLYEVAWRDRPLPPGMPSADFMPPPAAVAERAPAFSSYLAEVGVNQPGRLALLDDLELLSRRYAVATLDDLGWERRPGEIVDSEALRASLGVHDEHRRLFRRLLEMLARSGILEETDERFRVAIGSGEPLPDPLPPDGPGFADQMAGRYPHGRVEIGLFRRCAGALPEVLRGRSDPLTLLFSSGSPTAADLYLKAPVAQAANRMLADAVTELLGNFDRGRRLRVLEVGAGTGSATASVLPVLPGDGFDYTYTDISAGFFAEAEARFGGAEASINYYPLDVEKDPADQGYAEHGFDLVIASNVLHATRHLQETLDHCRRLLAPSGYLVALENLRGQGWLDLTFGQLDGWWRFADDYRPQHALAGPRVWKTALADAGFASAAVLGVETAGAGGEPDRGVILAQGPARVSEAPGVWAIASAGDSTGDRLAIALAERDQTVLLVGGDSDRLPAPARANAGLVAIPGADVSDRGAWRALLADLPAPGKLAGVVHAVALEGCGADAGPGEFADEVKGVAGSAMALLQGIGDADLTPERGMWFLTRGGQVLEHEKSGNLAGALLWGVGKVVARELSDLGPRMLDLDPDLEAPIDDLVNELLYPDSETHIAYRRGVRQAARLTPLGSGRPWLQIPTGESWTLCPDEAGVVEKIRVEPLARPVLEPDEVRLAVEAAGLNFWDVFRSLGLIDEGVLGGEVCGRVLEAGADVTSVAVGDRVLGLGFGSFRAEMVTKAAMVVPAPADVPLTGLATIPTAFVSAALAFDEAGLRAGDRVLIHAGAGGVGLAAIQLARAAGAEVFATASAPKQAYLRSLGVEHVFDSRQTDFGRQILAATDGVGVDVVVNSLTGEGFIDASLSCLAEAGRFVELARVDIFSPAEMTAARPDVSYSILELDTLKESEPVLLGQVLERLMKDLDAGRISPLVHNRWSIAETAAATDFMRAARHVGKIILAAPPLASGRLRGDRTYLVTGGLGDIGCAVAGWLAERGAGALVLNGRREPGPAAEATISNLREQGVRVQVELADVTDPAAVDAMIARIGSSLPPLGGVIHSVGTLADAAIANQDWDRFDQVLAPKVLGAWHLHRATRACDLDLFILFSSLAGVLGNPGQANHAAANAFLDQLAAHRRSLGLAGQAIAWGAWSELGEAEAQRERIQRQLEAAGRSWISPQQGMEAFDRLVRSDVTGAVVGAVDWDVLADSSSIRLPLLAELVSEDDGAQAGPEADPLAGLATAQVGERERILTGFLQDELQAVMRLPTLPPPTSEFSDLGMDSLMAVELRNRINRAFEGSYVAPNTVVFDYPQITGLARHIAEQLGGVDSVPEPADPTESIESPPARLESDAVAIVGVACRFPGGEELDEYWRALLAGESGVTDGRPDDGNWEGVTGDPNAENPVERRGAFLKRIDEFDSRFFKISPIEARLMDPQQRLLLETSWQALEDAGIDPDSLRGSRTGVFAGIGSSEYRRLAAASGRGDSYLGTAGSVAAGRVAFVLGLAGPAVPIDLACSSGLVAIHQAIAGLQRGEIDLALAGGVNVALAPTVSRFLTEAGMLSPSGECWSFDAAADGYVRGEGCGIVILKPLSRAEADGDRIWGVIRGSAINQNGAGMGLTVPNGPAQVRVMEEALARSGYAPAEIDYVEAHGPGTMIGDPIEAQATGSVYGRARAPERPLLIGSVKTNIGHLESAGAIAGLIKVLLAMRHRVIPRHLHFADPSPAIDWDNLPLKVVTEATPWPGNGGRAPLAGVNVFGISGSNAHLIVEGYPDADNGQPEPGWPVGAPREIPAEPATAQSPLPRPARFLSLSGKTPKALSDLARRYLHFLDRNRHLLTDQSLASDRFFSDMAYTAGIGRSHFDYRAGPVFADLPSLQDQLTALAENEPADQSRPPGKLAFAYTGQASQWPGMGRTLYETEPVFRAVLERCDAALARDRDRSLLDVILGNAGDLDDPAWTQPAIYALECALTALWESIGLRPDIVVGHSLGEIAAAQAAGVFSLEDGLAFAAANDPGHTLTTTTINPPRATFISGLTGKPLPPDTLLDAGYWADQARNPVAFRACISALAELETGTVIEIGPQPVLGPMISLGWPNPQKSPINIASLRGPARNDAPAPPDQGFARPAARAYEAGLALQPAGLYAGERRHRIALPTYPFQRRRHWF